MNHPSGKARVGAIVWALLIGAGVVILGASVMLPSTKRARIDFQHQHELQEAATTAPAQP
jgi:hypothetical protein